MKYLSRFRKLFWVIPTLLLVQCSSEQETYSLLGKWQGYSPQDGYYEVVIDSSQLHVLSSLQGLSTVAYSIEGDSLHIGKLRSALRWEGANILTLVNERLEDSIFRMDDTVTTHLTSELESEEDASIFLGMFRERAEDFCSKHDCFSSGTPQ